jgi:hypothetical protein
MHLSEKQSQQKPSPKRPWHKLTNTNYLAHC